VPPQKKVAPKGQKATKVAKTKAVPKKDAKSGKKSGKPASAKEASKPHFSALPPKSAYASGSKGHGLARRDEKR
jgi:hypothetical protein